MKHDQIRPMLLLKNCNQALIQRQLVIFGKNSGGSAMAITKGNRDTLKPTA